MAPAQHTQSIKHDPHPCPGTTDCPVLPCTVPVPLPPLHTIITEQEAEMQMASTPWRRCAGKKFFILSLEKKKKGFFLMMSLTSTATSSVVTSRSQTSLTLGVVAEEAEEVMDIAILLPLLEHLLDFSSHLLDFSSHLLIHACSH